MVHDIVLYLQGPFNSPIIAKLVALVQYIGWVKSSVKQSITSSFFLLLFFLFKHVQLSMRDSCAPFFPKNSRYRFKSEDLPGPGLGHHPRGSCNQVVEVMQNEIARQKRRLLGK